MHGAGRPKVVVGGLGPAGPELVTVQVAAAVERHDHVFLRTRRHPSASIAPSAESFDALYEESATTEEVYRRAVDLLVAAAAEHRSVLYLVPGSADVAERTVELLRARDDVDVEVLTSVSFLELVWDRLGVDPLRAGVRLVDGHRFRSEAAGSRGPLLVGQCDASDVMAEVKLALGELLDAAPLGGADVAELAPVTVLKRLGLPDESVERLEWYELDRVQVDHLTSVWIPELAAPIGREVERFSELVATLRRECPWDQRQTHQSLTRHLLEEAYEVLEAIDELPDPAPSDDGQPMDPDEIEAYVHLEEELGDLLFQVAFHSTLAAEAGQFTFADVARGVHDKLRARHPHVFADVVVEGADDVVRNWEQIKKAEKGRSSVFEGMPAHLPALLYALKVQKKSATLSDQGVELPDPLPLESALEAVTATPDVASLGELLYAVVELARRSDVDPERALRAAAVRHREAAMAQEP